MNLTNKAIKFIEAAIDRLFIKAKARFLGKAPPGTAKGLIVSLNSDLSVTSLFKLAAKSEGVGHNEEVMGRVLSVGTDYLTALQEKAKAVTINKIESFIEESNKNKDEDVDLEGFLDQQMNEVWGKLTSDVKRVVDTESTVAQNVSILDSITKINAYSGINDPTVAFLCVHDNSLCKECKRLHLLPDGVTPKAWKVSDLGSGFHKIGDPSPKVSGLHPHERCTLITLLPGYGFTSSGKVTYKSPGWDEYAHQRGL
jgi:hypothetical protein